MNKLEKIKHYVKDLSLEIIKYDNIDEKAKLKDTDGYVYYLSPENIKCTLFRKGEFAKFFNGNPYTFENIKNYLSINNIEIDIVSDFNNINNAKQKIEFKCNTHGTFLKSWNEIKNGQYCPTCSLEKVY
jgi:hypothetical protein